MQKNDFKIVPKKGKKGIFKKSNHIIFGLSFVAAAIYDKKLCFFDC